jgi:small subunit ribosomal protein S20
MAEQKKDGGKKTKVKRPTALKRDEQSIKRNLRNRAFRSKMNTALRAFEDTVSKKDATSAKTRLNEVYSIMDKGVKKGIFKLNRANRVKSRLSSKTKQLSA